MNSFMENKWSWIEGTHGMRQALLDSLNDQNLAFNPGGENVSLGELLRENGEVEYAYLQSLKTFTTDFSYRNPEPGLDQSVEALKAWLASMDAEMKAVLSAFSEDDLRRTISRNGGFEAPVEMQMEVYLQALLIFFGKAVVYLKAMNKPRPPYVDEYIG